MPAVQASVWHVQDGLPGSSLGSRTQELCCPACPSLVAVADFSSCSFTLSIYLRAFPSETMAVRPGLCFDGCGQSTERSSTPAERHEEGETSVLAEASQSLQPPAVAISVGVGMPRDARHMAWKGP